MHRIINLTRARFKSVRIKFFTVNRRLEFDHDVEYKDGHKFEFKYCQRYIRVEKQTIIYRNESISGSKNSLKQ